MGILTPTWKPEVTWQENLRAWEFMISEYEKMTGEQVTDITKVSVITRWAPEALQEVQQGHTTRSSHSWARVLFDLVC